MNTSPQLALHADVTQRQTLSPRLQHAVRLLQLSSLEFTQELQALQGRNPFLDFEEEDVPAAEAQPADYEAAAGAPDEDRDAWVGDVARAARQHEGADASALDFVPGVTSLAAHLHFQLSLLRLPERDLTLAHAIVDSLDDDGYYRMPLADLLPIFTAMDPDVAEDELLIALRRVQSLEPLGVGARDVKECLSLQLVNVACPHERALAAAVIELELDALAKHQWAGMARRLACAPQALDAAVRRIRQMDPRPGWRHGAAQTRYITPDVLVRKKRGKWTATLNSRVVPRVTLNKTYAELMQQHGGGGPELSGHLQEARWTMRNIEQRFSTIESVAQAIVDRQAHFLDYGPMAMKPLGLREIAEALGMHESTVSRVTSNKYMATPGGVFELKHFFSRAHLNSNGSACSPTAIRGLVQRMLESESTDAAQSDAEIARRLKAQGLDVARRTVTKYRQMLRIEPCDQRRKAAA